MINIHFWIFIWLTTACKGKRIEGHGVRYSKIVSQAQMMFLSFFFCRQHCIVVTTLNHYSFVERTKKEEKEILLSILEQLIIQPVKPLIVTKRLQIAMTSESNIKCFNRPTYLALVFMCQWNVLNEIKTYIGFTGSSDVINCLQLFSM